MNSSSFNDNNIILSEELEKFAIRKWQEKKLKEAREAHWLARKIDSSIEWIKHNDYWFFEPDFRVDNDYIESTQTSVYKNAKISVLIVGYSRPEGAMRCVTSARLTADRPELVEIMVVTDESDPLSERYKNLPETNSFIITQHETSKKWNHLYSKCAGDIIVMVADDVIFESRGWDELLRRAWPDDGIAVMFSDNGDGFELLEFPVISRKIAESLGYAAYPGLHHVGLDSWWEIIGKNLGRLYYLGDVWKLRHEHYEVSHVHNRRDRKGVNMIRDYEHLILEETEKLRREMIL